MTMNKEIKGTAAALKNKIIKHHASVDAAMSVFRQDMSTARREAARFKDEENELRQRQDRAARAARAKIQEADAELIDGVKFYTGKMKEYVSEYISERPPRDFIENLRVFKDFGLTMERGELDGLILASEGNYLGLKALSATAQKCGGWNVSAPSVEAYNQQIAQFNRYMTEPIQYCNTEYLSEGCAIYDEKYWMREDGTRYTLGQKMDSTFLLVAAAEDKQILEQLEAMGDSWSASFVPQIGKLQPVKETNEQGEEVTVSPEEQHQRNIEDAAAQVQVKEADRGVKFAKELGQREAAARAQAKKGLEVYASR